MRNNCIDRKQHHRPAHTSLALAIAAATALGTATASAMQLEEVVVTAQKRAQTANDIGMAISTYTGDDMKDMGVVDTKDIAAFTPGFTYTNSGIGIPVYTLRGVGYNDGSYSATSTVSVYVDEFAIPYPVMTHGAVLDLERVEVLKGPQGTLYGRNTTGGAINYIAVKPGEEFEAGILASYGSYQTFETEAYVSGPLGDNVRARLAARTVQSGEGWQENPQNGDELGEKDTTSLRLTLAADMTDNLSGQLQLSWWNNKSDTPAPQYVKPAFQNPNNPLVVPLFEKWQPSGADDDAEDASWIAGQEFSYDMEGTSANLALNYVINDAIELVSLTGYSTFDDSGSSFDRSGFTGVPFAEAAPLLNYLDLPTGQLIPFATEEDFPWVPENIFLNDASIDFFSQEFRLLGSMGDVNWVAGLYYSTDENDSTVEQFSTLSTNTNGAGGQPFLSFSGVDTTTEQESETLGAYFHTEWQFTDTLRLTAGLRYSDDEIDFYGCSADPRGDGSLEAFFFNVTALGAGDLYIPPGFDANGCATALTDAAGNRLRHGAVENKLEEDSWSYKLALDWFVTEDIMLYGNLSRGFKSGAFPNVPANVDRQYDPVVQEQLDSVEGGMKATLLDGGMQVNASVYYYDYKDKQLLGSILDPTFGVLRLLENVPEATVKGAELDVQWQPLDGLYIALGGSYIDSEVEEYTGPSAYGEILVFDGSPFPYTAEFQANALVNYEWPISDGLNAIVGFDVNHTDEIPQDFEPASGALDPDFILDSYTVANARFGISDSAESWRAMLWVRNLTDEVYANNAQKSPDAIVRYTGMPRTYGVTFQYAF